MNTTEDPVTATVLRLVSYISKTLRMEYSVIAILARFDKDRVAFFVQVDTPDETTILEPEKMSPDLQLEIVEIVRRQAQGLRTRNLLIEIGRKKGGAGLLQTMPKREGEADWIGLARVIDSDYEKQERRSSTLH